MTSLASLILFASTTVQAALGDVCELKQKNAASFKFAQELLVPVQKIEVIDYQEGPWTRASGNNVGSDLVVVRYSRPAPESPTEATYRVSAKQIGTSSDCHITGTTRVR